MASSTMPDRPHQLACFPTHEKSILMHHIPAPCEAQTLLIVHNAQLRQLPFGIVRSSVRGSCQTDQHPRAKLSFTREGSEATRKAN